MLLFAAGAARADVPSPGSYECNGKGEGDACETLGQSGACVRGTCYRNDYSNGPPPRSVPYECMQCQPGAQPARAAGGICSITSRIAEGSSATPLGAILVAMLLALRSRRR
ncbi:MAG: hypothetical protein K8H88_34770 [Sandaracinaceae bacterium]|nr:hypothetical protein [Sandaracinaceae bacterium]